MSTTAVNDQLSPDTGSGHARFTPDIEFTEKAPFVAKDGDDVNLESSFVTEPHNGSTLHANESETPDLSVSKVNNEAKLSLPVIPEKKTSAQATIEFENEPFTSLDREQQTSNGVTKTLTKVNSVWDIFKWAYSSDYRKSENQNELSEQEINRSSQNTLGSSVFKANNEVENKLHLTTEARISASSTMKVENKKSLVTSASDQHSSTDPYSPTESTRTNSMGSVINVTLSTIDAHTESPDTLTQLTSGAQSEHHNGDELSSSKLAPASEANKSNESALPLPVHNNSLSVVCCSSKTFQIEADEELHLPMSIALLILITYVMLGALGYSLIQPEWSFFESFYFVFISITTIGFGDLVPNRAMYMVAAILYFVFGLALASMCINVVSSKFSSSFKRASSKLGSSMGMQMVDGSLVPMKSTAHIYVIHKNRSTPKRLIR